MKNERLARKVNTARTFRGYRIRCGKAVEANGRFVIADGDKAAPSAVPHCVKIHGQTIRVTLV